MAIKWLKGLVNKPTFVTIDNEIEIASSTHQDMHPAYVVSVPTHDISLIRIQSYGLR